MIHLQVWQQVTEACVEPRKQSCCAVVCEQRRAFEFKKRVNAIKRHRPRCSCYCTPSCRRIDTVIRGHLEACMPSLSAHDPREFVVIVWTSLLPLIWPTNYMVQSRW